MENTEIGKIEHNKHLQDFEDWTIQKDRLRVTIPLTALSEEVNRVLDDWWVEEFQRAYIDWEKGEIILDHETEHYLPKGYEEE